MASNRRLKPIPNPDLQDEASPAEHDLESVTAESEDGSQPNISAVADVDAKSGEAAEDQAADDESVTQVDTQRHSPVPPSSDGEDSDISAIAPPPVQAPKPRRWRRRAMMLVLLLGLAALGLFAVQSWPSIRDRYITPVETTAADLTSLTEQVSNDEARIDALAADLEELRAETEVAASDLSATASGLSDRLGALEDDVETQTRLLGQTEALVDALGDAQTASELELQARVSELHATELMSRARLFMFQANYGLAEQDLVAARETLARLDGSEQEGNRLQLVVERLDRAIENVSDFPVVATNDLDIAWQLLLAPIERPVEE